MNNNESQGPHVHEDVVDLLGWPTDIVSIDYSGENAHTTIVFIPGNPGCCAWYTPLIRILVTKLGPGFCARLVSYAGHAPYHPQYMDVEGQQGQKDASIAWTVDGQIRHKEVFLDTVCSGKHNLVFVSHSIGSHMVQRVLMQRTDILQRTLCIIHLMPFIRMHPTNPHDQTILNFGAANPNLLIFIARSAMRVFRALPLHAVDLLLNKLHVYQDDKGRDLAAHLVREPTFARNFFELGTEEIRDVPFYLDRAALRQLSAHCPISMVYCDNDQWAPYEHVPEIQQQKSLHPISIHHLPTHKHDFVGLDDMVPPVMECCYQAIQQSIVKRSRPIRSRI
jgi:pimeloyl-ACP methyl ester carboxylesterase